MTCGFPDGFFEQRKIKKTLVRTWSKTFDSYRLNKDDFPDRFHVNNFYENLRTAKFPFKKLMYDERGTPG